MDKHGIIEYHWYGCFDDTYVIVLFVIMVTYQQQ